MKTKQLILTIFCCILTTCIFSQTLSKNDLRDKEASEIAYITECIKANRKPDNLIEWKLSSSKDNFIVYEHNGRLAFFKINKNTRGKFLHTINYFKNSFQKMIFIDENLDNYKITNETRFKVWMSKNKLSIYFCLINPDKVITWVLTKNGVVYCVP